MVRHNCVRRAVGLDTDPAGKFNTPYFTWGLYLDNWSSNFTVDSNIFHTNVLGGVFVHGGSNNTVTNNVAFNTSNASMPPPGEYGHCPASSGVLFGAMQSSPGDFGVLANNRWSTNIVLAAAAAAAAGPGGDPMAIVGTTARLNFSQHFGHGLVVDNNTYWSPAADLAGAPDVTPLGSWTSWQRAGFPGPILDFWTISPAVLGATPLHTGSASSKCPCWPRTGRRRVPPMRCPVFMSVPPFFPQAMTCAHALQTRCSSIPKTATSGSGRGRRRSSRGSFRSRMG